MRFSPHHRLAFVFIGSAFALALACLVFPDHATSLFRVAIPLAIVGAVFLALADLRAPRTLPPPPTNPDEPKLTQEQLEGRRELRAMRRAKYLGAIYGTQRAEDEPLYNAFSDVDALRRKRLVADGQKRVADAQAAMASRSAYANAGAEVRAKHAEASAAASPAEPTPSKVSPT